MLSGEMNTTMAGAESRAFLSADGQSEPGRISTSGSVTRHFSSWFPIGSGVTEEDFLGRVAHFVLHLSRVHWLVLNKIDGSGRQPAIPFISGANRADKNYGLVITIAGPDNRGTATSTRDRHIHNSRSRIQEAVPRRLPVLGTISSH